VVFKRRYAVTWGWALIDLFKGAAHHWLLFGFFQGFIYSNFQFLALPNFET
jgi:hypothetical protein